MDFYFVDAVELLRLWWNAYGGKGTIKAIAMFEKHYLQMSSLNLDDFCRWVYHVRKSSIQGKEADILEGKPSSPIYSHHELSSYTAAMPGNSLVQNKFHAKVLTQGTSGLHLPDQPQPKRTKRYEDNQPWLRYIC